MKILNWGILLFLEEKKILKIRKFERADLPQVLELCREVRQYHTDILGGYFAEQDDAFEQSGFLATLEDDRMTALVAEEGEEINGYLLAEKKYSPYLREPNVVHISNIGVKKGLRGKGIGKKLMDALFEMCKAEGVDEIRLGVFNKNTVAYKFYERYGFEPFEQRMSSKNIQFEKSRPVRKLRVNSARSDGYPALALA